MIKVNVSTISGTTNLVEDSEKVNIMLSNGTRFYINDTLYSSKSRRNMLSFKDIRRNGYHIETVNEDNVEYFYITSIIWLEAYNGKTLNFLLWVVSYNYKVY